MKALFRPLPFALLVLLVMARAALAAGALSWPEPTREQKPWTRWWWLGSAVDETNLTRQLEQFAAAGIGGVELCPIYGVKGQEHRHVEFLSPRWMELLAHATREAKRLGLGFDLTTGTGWPFGGPEVGIDKASSGLFLRTVTVSGGKRLEEAFDPARVASLMAFPETGEPVELKDLIRGGRLDWTAPPGQWRLHIATVRPAVQKVKRPAPGGAGNVLDPYSTRAMEAYLARFDVAFRGWKGVEPRAQFHDSFEYYGATWTPDLLAEFQKRRGYDLRKHFPALAGEGPDETVARVKADYRETLSELHLDYMRRWGAWTHRRGGLVRNQAHGAPANLVDLYAASDIPETEIFGSLAEGSVPMNKFSSSAANLAGRRLASAESFTWLGEHFNATLGEVKAAADYLFLCGVNHVFFHGIPYSPADAPWPGWQFYASVNFGPQGGLWRDLPAFNGYVSRIQSILQSGRPDNDVLLYFPVHDIWHATNGLLMTFTVHNVDQWLGRSPAYALAQRLWDEGYGYDHVSDRFLAGATVKDGRIEIGGGRYRAVVVPRIRVMPTETLIRLGELARAGARIVFQDALPEGPPGLADVKQRQALFALERLRLAKDVTVRRLEGTGLSSALGFGGETMARTGLRFVRRSLPEGPAYFVVNPGDIAFDDWLPLRDATGAVAVLDPLRPEHSGWAAVRFSAEGIKARLRLEPGQSLLLRVTNRKQIGPAWPVLVQAGEPVPLAGPWSVAFVEGGPELPQAFSADTLASWTRRDDSEAKRFAGTARYAVEFERPKGLADDWTLDLGLVADSARVKLNGQEIATLWSPPFRVSVGRWLQPGRNELEVEVTNVAANRIRDLDVRKVPWKYFEDANVVGKNYRPLDASTWPIREAGLLGPVHLRPMKSSD